MSGIKKITFIFSLAITTFVFGQKIQVSVVKTFTVDSLGACQGVFVRNGMVYLYGDREFGVIRSYKFKKNNLRYTGHETRLSANGKDIINHPTGIAIDPKTGDAYIGNSSRMNEAGTLWKATVFRVNWEKLIHSKTLDQLDFSEIEDDAAVQGTRPELVMYQGRNYVATADYGFKKNAVRLYDISKLSEVQKTSQMGVLAERFSCGPWVQNLHFMENKNWLVLVQNQIEGRYWRLTFLDFEKSLKEGNQQIISQINVDDASELEGFAMINNTTAIAVTSARKNNVSILKIKTENEK